MTADPPFPVVEFRGLIVPGPVFELRERVMPTVTLDCKVSGEAFDIAVVVPALCANAGKGTVSVKATSTKVIERIFLNLYNRLLNT